MVLAATSPVNSYVGNGATSVYPFTFPVFLQTHIVVTVVSSDGSTSYLLTLGTDYTVSGLSPNGSPALAGSITLVNTGQSWLTSGRLTTGDTISLTRVVPLAQTLSVRNQGSFYPASLEDEYDYIMMILQQNNSTGPIYTDIVTGYTYRIVFVDGVISQQRLT